MENNRKNIVVKYTLVDQILTPSGIESIEYSLNPYIGCSHGCVYCYARYLLMRRGYKPEDWGKIVFVKSNAISRLKDEIRWKKKGRIYLSTATDPYQPLENECQVTRRLLEVIAKYDWPLDILTKSSLVLRDLDLLVNMSNVRVGMSISVTEEYRRFLEPVASSYYERLRTLEKLIEVFGSQRVHVFFAPFIPILSEDSLVRIIDDLASIGIRRIFFDKLNIKAKNWITINPALEIMGVPKEEFWRKAKSPKYWDRVKKEAIRLAISRGMEVNLLF